MEYRVRPTDEGVYIEINDPTEGWMPIFGANSRGDFVGMPTCHPFDDRSNPKADGPLSIMLCIGLLTKQKTFEEIRSIAEVGNVYSVPGVTHMCSLTDAGGNVLHIVPGQGYKYYERPEYAVLTNFSPFKGDAEEHPWMGMDLVDAIPVLLFGANMIVVATLFRSVLFFMGALMCLFAGTCKVVWKIIVALKQKNVWWLFLQMRIWMPIGFSSC